MTTPHQIGENTDAAERDPPERRRPPQTGHLLRHLPGGMDDKAIPQNIATALHGDAVEASMIPVPSLRLTGTDPDVTFDTLT